MAFMDILKNIFWALLLLQIAPPIIKNVKTQYSDLLVKKTKIGIIPLKNTIYKSDTHVKNLKDFFENDEIKAIVLKVDCPGGAAAASQHIFSELKNLKNKHKKFVVAFVENVAGSGGYYIASAADYIISAPASFIGSIGSYIAHPNFKEFIEKYDVKYDVIKSGEYKTAGNPLLDLTQNQKQMLQSLSDNVYDQFVKDVAEQRKNLNPDVNKWANGQIFTGQQALELNLVDKLGSQSNVVDVLKEKVKIEEKIEWVTPKKKQGLLYQLVSQDDDSNQELSFNGFVNKICSSVEQRYTSTHAKL